MARYGIGIDFGTTNSVMSVYNAELKSTESLTDRNTNLPHPSIIWYRPDGTKIVGAEAKEHLMGYSNVEGNLFQYSVKRKLGSASTINVFGRNVEVYEVASEIFKYLHDDSASRNLDYSFDEAVVTIPVYFDGRARKNLRKAADMAGIYVKNFVHEPFAAIVGYCTRNGEGLQIDNLEGQIILVFDWGGGTLDITIAQVTRNGIMELSTSGIEDIAGDFFDGKLIKYSKSLFLDRHRIPKEQSNIPPSNLDRLRGECERAKISISSKDSETISVASILKFAEEFYDIDEPLDRDTFNNLINNNVGSAIFQINKALEAANVTGQEIDLVLLIGGSSRIPFVRHKLREIFGSRIVEIPNADTIISEGAAIIDAEGLQPVLSRPLNVELSDSSLYEVFPAGIIADKNICHKAVNFYCTDNRDGQAKLILKELAGRIDGSRPLMKEILNIPVNKMIPMPYDHERVTVDFALDEDMILHVAGKGATQEYGAKCQIIDLCFGLRLKE